MRYSGNSANTTMRYSGNNANTTMRMGHKKMYAKSHEKERSL